MAKTSLPNIKAATRVAAAVVMALCMAGCSREPAGTILPEGVELKPGDVVFRRGTGMVGRAVLFADAGGTYSHIGIVADSAGVAMVVHAVPDEPDYEGDPDRVKMERAEKFFSAVNAAEGCVMRPANAKAAKVAAGVAMAVYRRGALFDHDYNDADTTQMYCCELVEHAYRTAGWPLCGGGRHNFSVAGLRFRHVMLPSDFAASARLKLVAAFKR